MNELKTFLYASHILNRRILVVYTPTPVDNLKAFNVGACTATFGKLFHLSKFHCSYGIHVFHLCAIRV